MSDRAISLAAGVLPECAPIDVAQAAAAGGYRHCGFTIPSEDFSGSDLSELVRFVSAEGLGVLDVEVLWLDPGAEVTDVHRRKLDAGIALGAANALVVTSEADHGRNAEALHALCEHVGDSPMRVALEFLMITEVRSLAAASAIVDTCGHPKAGVLIDTLHLQRAGEGPDDVADFVAAAPSRLPYMQLCDGSLEVDDYLIDALDLRSAAGEGELPLAEVLEVVASDLPLSLEVRSKRYRDRYPDPVESVGRPRANPAVLELGASGGNVSIDPSFYEDFFNEAPDMFASIDAETARVKACNETLCRTLGYRRDEIVGMRVHELYDESCHQEVERVFRLFVSRGEARSSELTLKRRDGSTLDVSLRVTSHRDDEGNIVESRSIWRDLLLERRVEELELELRIQRAQKMESLALLAGGIAHDFNNLLVSILGNANLASIDLARESPVRGRLEAIEVAAQRASDLTRQLMAYSGSDARERERFELSWLVEEMGNLLEVAVSAKVVLSYELSADQVMAEGDITQIRQVVMNLLTNASDAVGDRSGRVIVRTGIHNADQTYLDSTLLSKDVQPGIFSFIEVADTGVGMSADELAKMFDPFYSTKPGGHGLGLAAVLGIVRAHRGTVRVYSEPGNGTSIKVLLPNVVSPEMALNANVSESRGDGEHVLLVDDEEHVRAVVSQMLERGGYRVTTREDGRAAVDFVRESGASIDLVLMDITMPHMDGIAALKAIRELTKDLPVVLMSGYSEQQATSALTGHSPALFVQKPFDLTTLSGVLAKALD